jgi:outer membrane protein
MAPLFAQAEGKIAVFSAQQAIMTTDAAQAKVKEFQAQGTIADKLKLFEDLQKKYKAAVEQVQKDLAMMSAEQKQAESKKINDMRADIEHVGRQLKQAEQEMAQTLMQEFGPRLQPILAEIVKSENIGLLLDKKAALHADASYDITAKVTDKLNQGK